MKIKHILGLLVLVLVLLSQSVARSEDEKEIRSKLPKMLGANNVGKDFWITFHPCWETEGQTNDLKVYVSAGLATQVTVEIPGRGYIRSKKTIPNDIIVFNIDPANGQCYEKDDRAVPLPDQVFQGRGVHIYANDPIVVYAVTRFHYTSDGFLALPVSSLGKEYIVASYADVGDNNPSGAGQYLPSYTSIVAVYDNTQVRFTLGGTLQTKTSGGMKSGQFVDQVMNKGDVWLLASSGHAADLSGSKIKSSLPVAVVSGNFCAYIPIDIAACDFISEMELPTNTWSKDYHVAHISTRANSDLIKVFAKEPKTKIFRDGNQVSMIMNAGGVVNSGYLEMRSNAVITNTKSVVISGDKPISVTQYNPGQQDDNILSDPFQMVLTPFQQYQNEIIFNTPGVNGDGFNRNYINLVYQATDKNTMPDDLMFAKVENGQFKWKVLKDYDGNMGERFLHNVDGKIFYAKTIVLPGDGVYKIKSGLPFTAYAYGFSDYDSYGFPTSVALADLEKPDTLPPVPTWTADRCTGFIDNGYVEDMPQDPDVRSNLAMIQMDNASSYNYEFAYVPVVWGEDYITTWKARVTDLTKEARLVVTFTDRRGNDSTIVINYYPTMLTVHPGYVDLGQFKVNDIAEKDFWIVNLSLKKTETITQLVLKKRNQNFEFVGSFDQIIPPNDSAKFTVRFTGRSKGFFADSIGIGTLCVFGYVSEIRANVGLPQISVTDKNFGDVQITKSASDVIIVRNDGDSPLNITGYTGPINSTIYTTDLPFMSPTNPWVIDPKTSQSFRVTFAPQAEIYYPDQIVFSSDAQSTDSICVLNGRGTSSSLTATSIAWNALRIDRPSKFPISPYTATLNYSNTDIGGIKLRNDGNVAVYISSISAKSVTPAGSDSVFEFDRTKFVGLKIDAQSEIIVPVKFHPQAVGNYDFTFEYNNSASSVAQTHLSGTGIMPRISTESYDFGTTLVKDNTNPVKKTVIFKNEAYEFGDSLTITDLTSADISGNMTSFGSKGFKYNKSAINFPVILQQDQTITFDAFFVAQDSIHVLSTLTSVSDAEIDQVSTWTGFGIQQEPILKMVNIPTICKDMSISVTDTLILLGNQGSIRIDSIVFVPPLPQIKFDPSFLMPPFNMKVGDTMKIPIIFSPGVAGDYNTVMYVYSNALDYPEIHKAISAKSVEYKRTTKSNLSKTRVDIGDQDIRYTVALENGDDIALAYLNQIKVTIKFKNDFLSIADTNFTFFNDYKVISRVFSHDEITNITQITLVLGKNSGYINQGGDILQIMFRSGLAYQEIGSELHDDSTIFISQVTEPIGTACVAITSDSVSITLNKICGGNLRPLLVSKIKSSVAEISPNPVGADGTELKVNVGLNSSTNICIYNSNGELVQTVVDEYLNSGSYTFKISTETMTSGRYWVKVRAGAFNDMKEMIVIK